MNMNDMKLLLKNYETIPRENKNTGNRELQAIREVRQLLGFMEKKILGQITEEDRKRVEENERKWMESIQTLREYIEAQ
ncbi:hypothetical protein [Faecalicatena contorta]|uniref:hypothetical protein n=1 Tax=Faecalicatena contorta TaxID=39482 RepID=UPI001F3ACBEA|nr:hypothetical protein [Faecalicatena contorta]MCF2554379.1 hypothetical protein [Faecalicatena contorta]